MIIFLLFIVSLYFVILYLVPNATWFTNVFLILNELCISIMFFTAILFAYLDKISNYFIYIN